jgi:hypothetical protein
MYFYEGHGPLALELTLDQWARWTVWLDRYVKNPSKANYAPILACGADFGLDNDPGRLREERMTARHSAAAGGSTSGPRRPARPRFLA